MDRMEGQSQPQQPVSGINPYFNQSNKNKMDNGKNDADNPAVSSDQIDHPLAANGDDLVVVQNGDVADSTLPVKIPIIGFETMEERAKFTIFKLRVENDKLDENWLVFRRYTDFVRLHSKLKEELPDIEISIPPKRWLRDNFETAFLEDRMKGLQALVDSILVQPKLVRLATVRKFFCLDEPPVYSDTAEETKSWCGIIEDSSAMLRHKLSEKDREIELLRAELALITTQKDNLLKLARNCGNCCQKQLVISASSNPSINRGSSSSTNTLSSIALPSSASSSEPGSPRHRTSLPLTSGILLVNKHRRSSTSSRTSSVHSEIESPSHSAKPKVKYSYNETYQNNSNDQATITSDAIN